MVGTSGHVLMGHLVLGYVRKASWFLGLQGPAVELCSHHLGIFCISPWIWPLWPQKPTQEGQLSLASPSLPAHRLPGPATDFSSTARSISPLRPF